MWYGVTNQEVELLSQVDEMFVRELVECSHNVPKDLLYLELGLTPIPYIIKSRKLMFLHHVLSQDENSLIYRFFMAQISHPSKGDWVSDILQVLEDLGIEASLSDIGTMTKGKFHLIVKEKVNYHALRYLLKKKEARN